MDKKYKIVEGMGQYFNKRWEVQEKYSYYENGKKITSWHTIFQSKDKTLCENVMKKYLKKPRKDYKIPLSEEDLMWLV